MKKPSRKRYGIELFADANKLLYAGNRGSYPYDTEMWTTSKCVRVPRKVKKRLKAMLHKVYIPEIAEAKVRTTKWKAKAFYGRHLRRELTQEDVWGKFDTNTHKRLSPGMVVARGYGMTEKEYNEHPNRADFYPRICPVWNDELPYKSVTVICKPEEQEQVEHWLIYVHGGGCVENVTNLKNGTIAMRSNYMCW